MKRKIEASVYFSVMETIDGLQVQRTFRMNVNYYKGKPLKAIFDEVCRLWLNAKGKMALTARMRKSGYYLDNFSFASGVELRKLTEVHWVISDNHIYPSYSAIPRTKAQRTERQVARLSSGTADAVTAHGQPHRNDDEIRKPQSRCVLRKQLVRLGTFLERL